MDAAVRIQPSAGGSVRALNPKQGSVEGEGQPGPEVADSTWPLGGAHGKVTIIVISHMAAGRGVALFSRWAGLGSSLPTHLFMMEPRCLAHLGGEFQHPHPHCPTWPLQEEFPGDPVSDTPWAEPW